jgi:hypothetical protein
VAKPGLYAPLGVKVHVKIGRGGLGNGLVVMSAIQPGGSCLV